MSKNYVEIDLKEVTQLQALLANMALTAEDEKKLLGEIGTELQSATTHRIASEKTDPDGNRWKAIAESTKKMYQKVKMGGTLLHRSGSLRDSVEHQVKTGSVLIGATMFYAPFLQDGTKKMVARPFLGLGTTDIGAVQFIVEDFLRRVV